MPIYCWEDKITGFKIEVLRDYKDYKKEPCEEDPEMPEEEKGKERDWERKISIPMIVNLWTNTTGSVKGRA